jgi:hypothetical protein
MQVGIVFLAQKQAKTRNCNLGQLSKLAQPLAAEYAGADGD